MSLSVSFPVLDGRGSPGFRTLFGETDADVFLLLLGESLLDRERLRELELLRDLRDRCFGVLDLLRGAEDLERDRRCLEPERRLLDEDTLLEE